MRHGFFAHAEVVLPIGGIRLRSMACLADYDNFGWSLPNWESAPSVLAWVPKECAYALGILCSREVARSMSM
jgi:hypothetical protein